MDPSERAVKSKRRYDGSRRREEAGRSRRRIIETAEERFLADGYAATTISAIAAGAGVSVDTIYKGFGGKPGLVYAIFQRALEGTGPEPAERRSDRIQAEEKDPRRIIRAWGRFTTEIAPRGTPLVLLIREAAGADAQLRALLARIDQERLERMTANAERLHRNGYLRPGVTAAQAADVLWTYSSPELYELLVLRRGMPLEEYGRFVADAMIAALLPGR